MSRKWTSYDEMGIVLLIRLYISDTILEYRRWILHHSALFSSGIIDNKSSAVIAVIQQSS